MSFWEGSEWQRQQEDLAKCTAKVGRSGCGHPGCEIDDRPTIPAPRCVLSDPLMLSVPAGSHVHLACPAHRDGHVIRGTGATV